jgi:predicted neutral ceramidase superfamily lipid hydrolase
MKDKGRAEAEAVREAVRDWIAEMAQRDNGAIFWKNTRNSEAVKCLSYGDLRNLLTRVEEADHD